MRPHGKAEQLNQIHYPLFLLAEEIQSKFVHDHFQESDQHEHRAVEYVDCEKLAPKDLAHKL